MQLLRRGRQIDIFRDESSSMELAAARKGSSSSSMVIYGWLVFRTRSHTRGVMERCWRSEKGRVYGDDCTSMSVYCPLSISHVLRTIDFDCYVSPTTKGSPPPTTTTISMRLEGYAVT